MVIVGDVADGGLQQVIIVFEVGAWKHCAVLGIRQDVAKQKNSIMGCLRLSPKTFNVLTFSLRAPHPQ